MRYTVILTENNKWVVTQYGGFDEADKEWAFSYASEVADFLTEQKKKREDVSKSVVLNTKAVKRGAPDEPPF